ncbi:MAG TPA: hypothetical protein VI755_06025 [Anaerolineales bacterium]|nr:hypothetical protein [Anaerolineales bacterium]
MLFTIYQIVGLFTGMEQRDQRRERNGHDMELMVYERQLEREEGLAKYNELEILRQAVGLPVAR